MKLPLRQEIYDQDGMPYSMAEINGELIALRARAEKAERERDSLREALEEIAQSRETGRHDGLPEEGPALEDGEMWVIARNALCRAAIARAEGEIAAAIAFDPHRDAVRERLRSTELGVESERHRALGRLILSGRIRVEGEIFVIGGE